MIKFLLFISIFLFSHCSFDKVVNHHGVNFLDKKYHKLTLNKSNKDNIIDLLGIPSTKSTFDKDIWIYIETKTTKGSLISFGKNKTMVNKVLILEIDSDGLLVKKDILNKDSMNEIVFSKKTTSSNISKNTFVYDFLSSMRQKINDPRSKRKK